MDEQTEAALSIIAAILVMLGAMLDAWMLAGLASLCLVALSLYKFARSRNARRK